MPPELAESIGPVLAMISIGTFVLIAMKMRYAFKARQLESPKRSDDFERLTEALDGLYEQTRTLHEELVELQERLDFHERLLTGPKEER